MLKKSQVIDRTYKVINEIGQGGGGIVYLAYHMNLQKYVVIKQIKNTFKTSEVRTEVDILKQLHHPNLPQVYDFLNVHGNIYTVIDYINGVDLEKYIKQRRPLTEEILIKWFRQLTDVLIYLHSQTPQIIHSDIKPSNIIIDTNGDAILIDFNISMAGASDLKGLSIHYASPEQIAIAQNIAAGVQGNYYLDVRTDIYSLASTFYHLISGSPASPFEEHIDLNELGVPLKEGFCNVIEKALRLNPEERYSSALEMKKSLDNMWKLETGYRLYLIGQICTIFISAICLAIGTYCLIVGTQEDKRKIFLTEYNECIDLLNRENYSELKGKCFSLLNSEEYGEYWDEETDSKSKIYYAVAECYFDQQDFGQAVNYYETAMEQSEDSELIENCFQRELNVYMENHEIEKAEKLVSQAKYEDMDTNIEKLLELQLECFKGDENKATEIGEQLISTSSNREICAKACVALGDCIYRVEDEENKKENLEKAMEWYKKANSFHESKEAKRGLAIVSTMYGDFLEVGSGEQIHYYKESKQNFQELLEDGSVAKRDYYYYAINCYKLAEYSQAIEILKEAKNLYPDEGIIDMYLAFSYEQRGDLNRAAESAQIAKKSLKVEDIGIKFTKEDWERLQSIR